MGCSASTITRWEYNPCSTQAVCKNKKLAVIKKAEILFGLTAQESEALANKAGLSLSPRENGLADIRTRDQDHYRKLLKRTAVSERMLQYYAEGKEPTKQAVLAIAVSIGLTHDQIQALLAKYGYCLSKSLPNDAVVLWFLDHSSNYAALLYSINEVLEALELPILMTKIYNR